MMKSSLKPCTFKDPAIPIVDGGQDEDEKIYLSEFNVNKIEESISDSNNSQHVRTDDMVLEIFQDVIYQENQSTSAFGFAVWQEVDDAMLTNDKASDYENPLYTDLVESEGYIDEQSINLLTKRANDSLIENLKNVTIES